VAQVRLPFRVPGALGALLVAGAVYYLMRETGTLGHVSEQAIDPQQALLPHEWMSVFRFEWVAALKDTVTYLPIVIPFALATVIGGIDCTESAAAAGDEYDTGKIIGVEAFATVVAALCGGVIQTTPYIGHPAYKKMGGRAAYTLATALFIGSAGLVGYFGYMYAVIPKAAVYPILMFVGLEITAQSFQATPKRHYAAVALACVPALAALAWIYIGKTGIDVDAMEQGPLRRELLTIRILANGFIVTSLVWASALAAIVDRRLSLAAIYFAIGALCTTFGIIHSPLPGGPVFLPWQLEPNVFFTVLQYMCGYAAVAVMLFVWGWWHKGRNDGPLT